ncbi:MAG: VWD domain-containing protein, partial [Deltaproteobacteria bacterium]|nr:VWD domain-containing protein [Deltaproteobacteria bacterium]
ACDECKKKCRKKQNECKKADKGLCRIPGVGGVCKIFKFGHCPASGYICAATGCGTMPNCDPPSLPGWLLGDPHLSSLDRMRFDFQGVGEYWIARSEKADVEIQARLSPYGSSRRVSVVAAASIRAGGHVITFLPNNVVTVDQQSVEVTGEGTFVSKQVTIVRTPMYGVLVATPGVQLWVRSTSSHLNVSVGPEPSTRGTWEGLLGDFDGSPDNDFRSSDKTVFARKDVTREVLYGKFGDSWRITQKESFLPYEEGQTTETFTDRSFPDSLFNIAELSEQEFAKARSICVNKGVSYGEALRNCIYDLGVTSAEVFAEGYELLGELEAKGFINLGGKFGMRVQSEGYQGGYLPVFWSGPAGVNGLVTILDDQGKRVVGRGTNYGNPAVLRMPAKAGTYTVQYKHGEETTSAKLEVKEATATITAPDSVVGADEFELSWTGPMGRGDFISLDKAGSNKPNQWLTYRWAHKGKGRMQAPALPGKYELRYVLQGAGRRQVIASRPLTVTAPSVSLQAPAKVTVGGDFEVTWSGPGGGGDYVDLAAKGHTKIHGYVTYGWARKDDDGKPKPARLRAPTAPGSYDIRYIATPAGGRAALAKTTIVVEDTKASLQAPKTVAPESKFEISWTGPMHRGDFVTIAELNQPGDKYVTYQWARNGKATFKAPKKPGSYQVRYILAGPPKRRVLSKRPIVVKAP